MKLFSIISVLIIALPLWAGRAVFLAVTDSHCHVENLRRLAGIIERERRQNPGAILVDNGDTIQGTFYGADTSVIGVQILNALKFDLWSPGNHDFELHSQAFSAFKGTVPGANWRTAQFTPKPWTMLRRGKCKIAVIGLTENSLELRLLPSRGVKVKNQTVALTEIMPEIRRAGANLIVLMTHNGAFSRQGSLAQMLRQFPEIQLVIGGHTHESIEGTKIGRAWFVQPGKHGECLGKITVDFDDNTGKVQKIHSKLIPVAPETPEAKFPDSLENDLKRIKNEMNTVAGTIPRPLNFAQIMAESAKAQCAIYTGNTPLLTGKVTHGDIFRLMPYENRICTVRLTQEELRKVAGNEFRMIARSRKRRHTVFYGMTVKSDRKGNLTNFQPPAPEADGKVTVALCDYYLAGSGGYSLFMRPLTAQVNHTGILLRDAIYNSITSLHK